MPVKRRADKSRRWRICPEAAERWRLIRGLQLHSPVTFLDDEELCELVGWPFLLAMPEGEARALFDALEEAA